MTVQLKVCYLHIDGAQCRELKPLRLVKATATVKVNKGLNPVCQIVMVVGKNEIGKAITIDIGNGATACIQRWQFSSSIGLIFALAVQPSPIDESRISDLVGEDDIRNPVTVQVSDL